MIDVKEFRIGNWVQVNGFPMYVVSIHDDGSICCNFDGNEGDVWEFDDKTPCDPIILTDEILLKCGFDRVTAEIKGLGIFPAYVLNGIKIIYFSGSYVFHQTDGINVKYLHKLQNFFFELRGKELEIKL